MDPSAKLSSDVAVSFVMKTSLKIRGLVLIPLLSILVGVAEYGAYTQVILLATLLANVCSLRLDSGFVRYVHRTDRPAGLFTSLVLLGTAVAAIGGLLFSLAAVPLATYTLQDQRFSMLFVLGGLYVPLKCLYQFGRGYFRAERRIKLFSILEAIDVYLSVAALTLAVVVLDTWITGVFAAVLLAHGAVVVAIYVAIGVDGGFGRPDTSVLTECLRFSIGSMGHLVSQSLLDKIDRVLLGYFLGASAVGIYSAAYSVAYTMLLYFRPLSISFFPEFSKLWEDDKRQAIRSYATTGFRFVATLGLPSIAGFWLVGDGILGLLSTPTVASEGALVLVLLASGMLAKGIGEIYAQLFFAANDSRTPAIVQGGVVVFNSLTNVLLIPIIGIDGAALATLLSFVISAVVLNVRCRRYLSVGLPWNDIERVLVATAGMTGVVWLLELHWIVTVAVAPVIYFGLLFLLGGIRTAELRFVVNSIR